MPAIKKTVIKEEEKLKEEFVKEEKGVAWFLKSHTFKILLILLVIGAMISAVVYLSVIQGQVYVENSEVSAPIIPLSSATPGILQKVFVKEGDTIAAGTVVAQVNDVQIKSEVSGLVISVDNSPGKLVSPGSPIVSMIEPSQLRIVGHLQEDKGLSDVRIGQKVIFTVDAFSGKQYSGTVEKISPVARQSDIVFSISDARQENQFDISVKYDIYSYPELKTGMSAKMWIYK